MSVANDLESDVAHGRDQADPDPEAALAAANATLARFPQQPQALLRAAAALRRLGRTDEAIAHEDTAIARAIILPGISEAGAAIGAGRPGQAERALRAHLIERPDEPVGLRLLAEVAIIYGLPDQAEAGLRRALAIAPSFIDARLALANLLLRGGRLEEAIALYSVALADRPDHVETAARYATALGQVGRNAEAAEIYSATIARVPGNPMLRLSLGHALKTLGRTDEAIAAYRAALALSPELGEAWWALADLKAGAFDADDRAAMLEQLERPEIARPGALPPELRRAHRLHLHFALARALEDAGEPAQAFVHYDEANHIAAGALSFDAPTLEAQVDRSIAFFTNDLFAARSGQGCDAVDPIFVVGLPRSGSTLVEQILASHPDVEGTAELPYIPQLVERVFGDPAAAPDAAWPELLAGLPSERLRELGEAYLAAARPHRTEGKRFFIDKLPNNWHETGFIRLILPNAKIIDARRDPLDCCVSNFKQHFARGQAFAYDLTDLGRYYRAYLKLMRHFGAVQPGAITRVIHEDLVADPEAVIRALLDALGLGWDPAVLRPHENARPVRTASSEQVRQPINAAGVGSWRKFEPWLGQLHAALGDAERDWRR